MALTTHEKIRAEAGFQSRFVRFPFLNAPNSSSTVFYVDNDDNAKIVPEFQTGATIAGISDVKVFFGLSGVPGTSQLIVSSVDPDMGSVTLNVAPTTGGSLVITYASSAISSLEIEEVRKRAESIINRRLVICYDLPISPIPSYLADLSSRMAAALLLIRNYGTGAVDTSSDGYRLYETLMGSNTAMINRGSDTEVANVGEIGLICTADYELVDDDGNVIPRNDGASVGTNDAFVPGGLVNGRIFDVSDENWRFKDWQQNVNRPQPGSGMGIV